VDGTDFQINEPFPFNSKWYSKKFNGPGLRYEIALALYSDQVVWFSGPHPCGEYSDLKTYQSCGLRALLIASNERAIADGTYMDGSVSGKEKGSKQWKKAKSRMRARQESLNKRLKVFKMMREKFVFGREKHQMVFQAALFLVQLSLVDEPLMHTFT
jgi:hypothetical protein